MMIAGGTGSRWHPGNVAARTMAILACLLAAACTGQTPDASPSTQDPSVAQSPVIVAQMEDYIDKVDRANIAAEGTEVNKVAARPTVINQNGLAQSMVGRDVAVADAAAGQYLLSFYCVGEGDVYLIFRIGANEQAGPASCTDTAELTVMEIVLEQQLTDAETSVTIAPVGQNLAAYAYTITTS